MLKSLYIKNYALIDNLEIDFDGGFSVITGETGAGKSIILGALSLILGERVDTKSIRQEDQKCIIEGTFDISAYDLHDFYEENDLEYEPISILRREVSAAGKSRAFVNDSPVTLNILKAIGERLIDIHSQHENLLLSDQHFQLQVVDIMAGNKKLLGEYAEKYKKYKTLEKELGLFEEKIQKDKEEEEFLRFQYEALNEASLVDGELEELEEEQNMLNHAEDIKSSLYKIFTLLSDDDRGILSSLKESLDTAQSLTKIYSQSEELAARLQTAYIDLKDMNGSLERMAEDVEFNPDRLVFVQERLDLIYSLQARHKLESIKELIAYKDEIWEKISQIESSDEDLERLKKKLEEQEKRVLSLADQVTEKRKSVIPAIEKNLVERVAALGMPNVQFKCELSKKEKLDIAGADSIQFLFSANKNMPLLPVAEIASGGEISRFMLCLKSMIAGATALPTIIFDEVDTGVSGDIADKMGVVMQEFGEKMQVIAITHLPQIAARGSSHYKVYKVDEEDKTTTNLKKLTTEERLEEVAGMLSGATITDAAKQNAKVMLGL